MNTMLEKLDELESKVNRLLQALEDERTENSKLKSEMEQRSFGQGKLEELKSALEQEKNRHVSLKQETDSKISPLSEENRLLKEQLSAEKEKYRKLITDLSAFKSERAEDRRTWDTVHKKIENLLKELDEIPEEDDESVPNETFPQHEKLEAGEIREIELDENIGNQPEKGDEELVDPEVNEKPVPATKRKKSSPKKNQVEAEDISDILDDIDQDLDGEADPEIDEDKVPEEEDGYLFEEASEEKPEADNEEQEIFPPKNRKPKEEDDLI